MYNFKYSIYIFLTFYKKKDRCFAALRVVKKNGEWKPEVCIQCGKCAKVCENGAIKQNKAGIWIIDKRLCTGCKKCQEVCPFSVMVSDELNGKTTKCIACGKCVTSCPMDVLQIALPLE